MRRRKMILGILALVLCGVLVVAFWPENPEPIYQGKELHVWVEVAGTYSANAFLPKDLRDSFSAIGTNGIPFYLEWIHYKPSLVKMAQYRLADWGRGRLGWKWHPQDYKIVRSYGAH